MEILPSASSSSSHQDHQSTFTTSSAPVASGGSLQSLNNNNNNNQQIRPWNEMNPNPALLSSNADSSGRLNGTVAATAGDSMSSNTLGGLSSSSSSTALHVPSSAAAHFTTTTTASSNFPSTRVRPGGAPARAFLNERVVPYLLEGMRTVTRDQYETPFSPSSFSCNRRGKKPPFLAHHWYHSWFLPLTNCCPIDLPIPFASWANTSFRRVTK